MTRTAALLTLLLSPLPVLGSTIPFINEIHYDNGGTDVGEGIEIAGAAGTALDGWTLFFYNGSNGSVYGSTKLAGLIPDQDSGFGTLFFATGGLQNGAPDGVALVDDSNAVLQFLSYEGSFAATSGAAAGLTSVDIGLFESSDTLVGESLQLTGTGLSYGNFSWTSGDQTYGAVNTGQSFAVVPLPAPLILLAGAVAWLCGRHRREST